MRYGQRTQDRELRAFREISHHYGVERTLVADIGYLAAIGGSSLTDPDLEIERANLDRSGIPTSYVPFRNTHFLAIAVSWAEVIGAGHVFIGAVEPDSSGYPDCREIYYRTFNELVRVGTKPETHIEIVTPLIHMRKAEIIKRGVDLGAPLHLTWSCYKNNDVPCGDCDSCALRQKGFEEAGIADPLLET